MRMNTSLGKQVLSIIRGGDYAHPGEEEALDILFEGIPHNSYRKVLDVGCGLGGSANYIENADFGVVWGVDNDLETIAYAKEHYPQTFICCSALEISEKLPPDFDVIYMVNSYYTFPDQQRSLSEARAVARSGAQLLIFDYGMHCGNNRSEQFCRDYEGSLFRPVKIETIESDLQEAGWKLASIVDISGHFESWYESFLGRVQSKKEEIIALASSEWYQHTTRKFANLHAAVRDGVIQGVVVRAFGN